MNSNSRIILLVGEVSEQSAMDVILHMLDLNMEDESKPIYLYINSPGGSIVHGLAIMDTMNHIKAPVYTVCYGMAASMGAFLLSCGEKGHRYALPHSRILIHQPLIMVGSSLVGTHEQLKRRADALTKSRQQLEEILSLNTDKTIEEIHEACERDNWMGAAGALEYGLIDQIIEPNK